MGVPTLAEQRPSERGFSVLEAIVAMALVAGALVPLMVLQGQVQRSIAASDRAERRVAAQEACLNYMGLFNPAEAPEGRYDAGNTICVWRAEPVGEARMTLNRAGGIGGFELQRYEMSAVLTFPDGAVSRFTVIQLGWRATGDPVGDTLDSGLG